DSDFIPVMLYEWRSLSEAQRSEVNRLKADYEAAWVPVLQALHASGELRGDPGLTRLMLFGALNWSVQWYDPGRKATLDDLTQTALLLFLKDPT
ncbi:MAG: TetR/AcrR family transcriptional regulator, partial [Hydrogenophaga sp.]|nr:TetR/AcrR family transcriptional regulator [Hydrogenophaga sp.]